MGCMFETSNKNLRNSSIGHKHTSVIGKQRLNCNNNQRCCSCQKENLYHNSLSQTYYLKALPKRISGVYKWCPDKNNKNNSNKNENNNNNNNYNISNINGNRNNQHKHNNNNTTKIYPSKSKIEKYLHVKKEEEEEEEEKESKTKTLSIIVFAAVKVEQDAEEIFTIDEHKVMKCILLLEDEREKENIIKHNIKNVLIVISCFPKTKYIQEINSGLRLSCNGSNLTARQSAQLIGDCNFCTQNDNVTLSAVTPRTMIISATIKTTIAACKPQTELLNLDIKATNTANNLNTASGNIIKSNSCSRKQQHQLKQKSCYQHQMQAQQQQPQQNLYQNNKSIVATTGTGTTIISIAKNVITNETENAWILNYRTYEQEQKYREESSIMLRIRDAIRKLGHNMYNSMMVIQTALFYLNYRLKQQHQHLINNDKTPQIVKHHRDAYNLREFQFPGCSDNNNNNNNIIHKYNHSYRHNCNDNRGQRLLNMCNFNTVCRMLLLLCFLATTVVGAATVVETTTSSGSTFIDKHPM